MWLVDIGIAIDHCGDDSSENSNHVGEGALESGGHVPGLVADLSPNSQGVADAAQL